MSMILKDKLPLLAKGYPTVSDKYNVRGATLASTSPDGEFGDIVKFSTTNGYFCVVNENNTIADAKEVAGVLLATNVKTCTDFLGGRTAKVYTKAGEAFNLLIDGYVALECDANEDLTAIVEGDDAKLTATGKVSKTGTIDCGFKFTGVTYTEGTTKLAEVVIYPKNI